MIAAVRTRDARRMVYFHDGKRKKYWKPNTYHVNKCLKGQTTSLVMSDCQAWNSYSKVVALNKHLAKYTADKMWLLNQWEVKNC